MGPPGRRAAEFPTAWSPDGKTIGYTVIYLTSQSATRPRLTTDIWLQTLDGKRTSHPWLETPFREYAAAFSPDGKWIAYMSDESGSQEVYVRRFPGASGRWQVSTHGGAQPWWRRDGKELFYLAPDGKLMASSVKTGRLTFETGTPEALFNTGITTSFVDRRNQYVVTRDGQRFLVNVSAEDENSAPITVVLNWNAPSKP